MTILRRSSRLVGLWALWRLLGPEVPPRFHGPQSRPADIPGRTVTVGRHEFLVREAGPVSAPPVVLLHGWIYDGLATWHKVIPDLAADHRVLALDFRNHGRSARIRGRFDVADAADEVALVLDRLGVGRVPVVGYSMGGMIAQALASRHRERVAGLVLAATAARPVDRPAWLTYPVFYGGRAVARLDRLTMPRLAHRYLIAAGAVAPEHGAWLWESLLDRDVDLYYESGFAILRFDGTEAARRLDVPTHVIVPTADQLIPPRLQYATAALVDGAEVTEIAGARHEAVLTHPEAVAKAIRAHLATLTV